MLLRNNSAGMSGSAMALFRPENRKEGSQEGSHYQDSIPTGQTCLKQEKAIRGGHSARHPSLFVPARRSER